MTFDFEECVGNVFDNITPNDALVLCISEDWRSGKGMKLHVSMDLSSDILNYMYANSSITYTGAVTTFRQRHSNLHHMLRQQKRTVGQIAYGHDHCHVYYLVTKPKVYNRTSYADLESCLSQLRKVAEQLGTLSLAIPYENLDGLQEKHVKDLIFKAFHGKQRRRNEG